MASSSLVVKISADINDFSKQLRAMTKDVDEAAKKVTEVGKSMSIGLTLPLVAAAAAMAKFGMDQAATAAKFSREMGPAAAGLSEQFERITKVVPVTGSALEDLANTMDQFGRGAGMAAPQAALFSGEAVKMAAVLKQANPGASLADAGEALERGFEGSTKGLKSFGINVDAVHVKQEAYRLGLLKIGNTLTPLGTALATYSLLTQRLSSIQGEAAGVQHDVGTQWQFLKAQMTELAEAMGAKLMPMFGSLIEVGRGVVTWLSALPDWMKQGAIYAGIFAASLGPLIIAVAGVSSAIVKLKAAFDILKDVELFGKIASMVTAWEAVAVALAVVAVAVVGIAVAWEYFKKKGQEAANAADDILKKFAGAKDLLSLGGGAPTSSSTKDRLAELRASVDLTTQSFERALAVGDLLGSSVAALAGRRLAAMDMGIHDPDPQARLGGLQMFDQLSKILATLEIGHMIGAGAPSAAIASTVARQASTLRSPQGMQFDLAQQLASNELTLFARELALTVDTFDAPRVAAIELAEKFKQIAHDFATSVAEFKSQWSSAGNIGRSALAGLQEGAVSVLQGFTPMALAATAVGKIMQGFQPVLDKLMGPLVAFGQILGQMIQPLLPIIFLSLKSFGVALALLGEIVYSVAGGIAKVVGGLISAIGSFIRKIPFLGGIGKDIQNFGNSISNFGTSALDTAKQLDQSRIQLQNLDFDNAANGLNTLTNSATAAAESLQNLPQVFKVNLDKYIATLPISNAPVTNAPAVSGGGSALPAGSGGAAGAAPDPNNPSAFDDTPIANINIDGKAIAQITWGHVRAAASKQFRDPARVADVVRV